MNLTHPWKLSSMLLFRTGRAFRRLLPKARSQAFGVPDKLSYPRVARIYVINLDRQVSRWGEMKRELSHVLDSSGAALLNLVERVAAVDATRFLNEPTRDADVDPVYTLGDQLFVEPQPLALPTRFALDAPIAMSRPEVAIARSHIDVWRQVLASTNEYSLVLEDDVHFHRYFARQMDAAWGELQTCRKEGSPFDILYLSYQEVKHGAQKSSLSGNVFCPVKGLWNLSGYVLSREGAAKLLDRLPCRGPVDLWLNHQFRALNVIATRKSLINQRSDLKSTNSYSILPALTTIGAITSEAASLFHVRPNERPVFAFGPRDSGLTALAMALSMLGYTCCNDLQDIPCTEREALFTTMRDHRFNAYVNIGSLEADLRALTIQYPDAKFVVTADRSEKSLATLIDALDGADTAFISAGSTNKWQRLCEHLRCAPPLCSFPKLADLGQRSLVQAQSQAETAPSFKALQYDNSPWIIEPSGKWKGIHSAQSESHCGSADTIVRINDSLPSLDPAHWFAREDTFTDNLALFRSGNIEFTPGLGAVLNIKREPLGVRQFSAASICSHDRYLFGKFEAIINVSSIPGVITGLFLHRDSPRQEIDIEIAGQRPNCLLVNVFFNPGDEGARYDYGYRGSPTAIDLGFDASASFHRFAIEWSPNKISWFVDGHLVHERVEWEPTPIPHLPMALNLNAWPCRSKELAGRLPRGPLHATTSVRSIRLEANRLERITSL